MVSDRLLWVTAESRLVVIDHYLFVALQVSHASTRVAMPRTTAARIYPDHVSSDRQ
jgi:hypothetical protein